MRIFELKIDWERVFFYKKLSWLKEYLKVNSDFKKKDLDKLNILHLPWKAFFKENYILTNWSKLDIEIEVHNLVE